REGKVLLDGQRTVPGHRLRWNEVILLDFEEDEELPVPPVAPPVQIPVLYEDDHVLAVDKPADLAAEPERWARGNASLSGALLSLALERSRLDPTDPTRPDAGTQSL